MTREEAIRILDPETMVETLAEIEYYGGFRGRTKAANALHDACILALSAIQEQEERERGCEYCNDGSVICNADEEFYISGNTLRVDIGCHCYGQMEINFCPMCGRRLHLPEPTPSEANN